jgi:hypothetical protein
MSLEPNLQAPSGTRTLRMCRWLFGSCELQSAEIPSASNPAQKRWRAGFSDSNHGLPERGE